MASAVYKTGTLLHIIRQYAPFWLLLAGLLLLAALPPQHLGSTSVACPAASHDGVSYGIVFDAGSTGSRIHIFEFNRQDGRRRLRREVFEELKPGLSGYPDSPSEAAKSLQPLFDVAMRTVPASSQRCSSWALYATAGLRLLGAERSEAILQAVRTSMAAYPFRLANPRSSVAVMQGVWEGPYAWATIHFLLGSLGATDASTYSTVLDMGGASTQVVFAVDATAAARIPAESLVTMTLLGRQYTLFQHSYLGLGLKEAEKRVVRSVTVAEGGAHNFSCIIPGATLSLPKTSLVVRNDGSVFGFDACHSRARQALIDRRAPCPQPPCAFGGVHQPPLAAHTAPIVAISYFFDLMASRLATPGAEGGDIVVGDFRTAGNEACQAAPAGASASLTRCLDYAVLYAILHDGYELPDHRRLRLAKKIGGVETAWPLGAYLATEGA